MSKNKARRLHRPLAAPSPNGVALGPITVSPKKRSYQLGQPRSGGRAARFYHEHRKKRDEPKSLEQMANAIEGDPIFLLGLATIKAMVEGARLAVSNPSDDPRAEALATNLTHRLRASLPNVMKAFGRGRAAFEKVYLYNRKRNLFELEHLDYIEYDTSSIRLAESGAFDGVLIEQDKHKLELDSDSTWWFALDHTPANPCGKSRYLPAPWRVYQQREDLREHYERWMRKLSLGIGVIRAPKEYQADEKNTQSGYADTNMDGTPADPMEHGEIVANNLEGGGYTVISSEVYPDTKTPQWDITLPENKIDATPFEKRMQTLTDDALYSVGVPPRAVTQNADVGTNAMAQAHLEVLYETVSGIIRQIASSFEENVVKPAERINARGGEVWGLTVTFQDKNPALAAIVMEVVKNILTSPTPSPFILHGVVDLPKLLELVNLPLGDNVEQRLHEILQDTQKSAAPTGGGGFAAQPQGLEEPAQLAAGPVASVAVVAPIEDDVHAVPDAQNWQSYAAQASWEIRKSVDRLIDLPDRQTPQHAIDDVVQSVRRTLGYATTSAKLAGAVAPWKPDVLGLPASKTPKAATLDVMPADVVRMGYSYVSHTGKHGWASDPSKIPQGATNVRQTHHTVRDVAHGAGKVAVGAMEIGEAVEHHLSGGFNAVVDRLPAPVRDVVRGSIAVANVPFSAGRAAVEAFATKCGASPERAAQIAKFTTVANYGAAKAVAYGLHAAHVGGLIGVAGPFVPVVSVGYLAYSAARHPVAVLRAAHEAVAKVKSLLHLAQPATAWRKDFVRWAAGAGDVELVMACFAAAADQLHGDMPKALKAAQAAYGEASKGAD